MGKAATRGAVKGAVAAAAITAIAAGYAYSWQGTSYAAATGYSPVAGWNACLIERDGELSTAQPGVTPGSRLAYRALVAEDSNTLDGWEFFGYFRNGEKRVDFTCRSGPEGQNPSWLSP